MMKSNRIYHYHVTLHFKGDGLLSKIGRKTSGYTGTHGYHDTFIFYQKTIHLVLSRTKKYEDGAILSNASNSINTQIIKALLCYYSQSNNFPIIDKLSIIRKKAGTADYEYTETSVINQPLSSKVTRSLSCSSAIIDGLLEDNLRGQSLRVAMSYWIKGIASDDVYYKFEHLWRAFNRLFMYQGGQSKEFECMSAMRVFIIDNAAAFPRTLSFVDACSEEKLLSFRWSKMILNDYDTQKKTRALKDFVERYHDARIMRLFQQKLACRNMFLQNEGYLIEVNNHINSNLTSECDAELVTLLALKYAYFVRNKMFHGEMMDGTFKIRQNNIDKEISHLNELLEILVLEIMENYQLLRA